jgi:hypothetical protein
MPEAATVDLEQILKQIATDYPDYEFIESAYFSWHAGQGRIRFKKTGDSQAQNIWALLHELGHAILGHKDYRHDIELLQMEVAAWERARALADIYGVRIDEEYIQDCLDSYRDWLHLRATCPTCYARSLQATLSRYRCFNCQTEWQVSRNRLCRPYRLQKG